MTRVLHVVGGMNRGGVETWLMHVLRHIDREQFHMDFLVHTTQQCVFDDEIRVLGSRILPCPHPFNPMCYAYYFSRILEHYGPYDVIHSHVHYYSGYVLWLAHRAKIRVRIAHSHTDTSAMQGRAGLLRRSYLILMGYLIGRYATLGLAVSRRAAYSLFEKDWRSNPSRQLLPYGIDLVVFQHRVDRAAIRAELGIPDGAIVLGHVGRFDSMKNHRFLIGLLVALRQRLPSVCLILVGDGPLRADIKAALVVAGVWDRVRLLGVRSDIPRVMAVFDVFLFPSIYEGFGIVLLEAQAAGVPCIASDAVPEEADVGLGLVKFLSLNAGIDVWIKVISQSLHVARPSFAQCEQVIRAAGFDIRDQVHALERIYAG